MDITEKLRDVSFCRFPSSNMALRDEAAVEIESLRELLSKALQWTDSDKPLPEDGAICDAHPLVTGDHVLYMEAMRIVGAKRSKGALVHVDS